MANRLNEPDSGRATPSRPAGALSPLTVLIRSVVHALQLQFSLQRKAEFIAELRCAQSDIDAFMNRPGPELSPSCRRLLLRFSTALEARLIAVSIRAQRQLVHDRFTAEQAAAAALAKARSP